MGFLVARVWMLAHTYPPLKDGELGEVTKANTSAGGRWPEAAAATLPFQGGTDTIAQHLYP